MAQHVIYNKETITIKGRFDSERGAKISFTRKKYDKETFAITSTQDFYDNVDKDVEVTNISSGLPATIRASQVGGPCDPSTERYHCM